MFTVEVAMKLWPVFLALVGVVVWCIRLEAEVRYLRKDHEEHKQAQQDKDMAVWKKLDYFQMTMSGVASAVARIEGMLASSKQDH